MKIHIIEDVGDHCFYAPCGYVETKYSCDSSFTRFRGSVTCKNCKRTRQFRFRKK